jgi:DNA-binding CsgD family transcriptional regulator
MARSGSRWRARGAQDRALLSSGLAFRVKPRELHVITDWLSSETTHCLDMAGSRISTVSSALARADDFIGVAGAVCALTKQLFALDRCLVWLHAASGRPLISVDALEGMPDEIRLSYFVEDWVSDPFLAALRECHQPIGDEIIGRAAIMRHARSTGFRGPSVHTLCLPILEPAGLVGQIRCGQARRFSTPLRRELTAMATHVSVRLAQLGISSIVEVDGLARLTLRQFDVAHLAALGRTNAEISTALDISENTVKKHLAMVYEHAGVASRTELAAMLTRAGPRLDVPVGISHRGGFTITRAPP